MNVFGPRIQIRPTSREDLPFLQALWNDGNVMRYKGYPDGMHVTDACMERWWSMTPQAQDATTNDLALTPPHCTLHLLDGTPIGELSYSLDVQRRARIDLKLAAQYWGQGLATEALTLALRELFAITDITKVIVEPVPANTRALQLFQRCGFHPAPTENHPHRWECTRQSFAERNAASFSAAS